MQTDETPSKRFDRIVGAAKIFLSLSDEQQAAVCTLVHLSDAQFGGLLAMLGNDKPVEVPREAASKASPATTADKPLFKPVKVRITTRVDADVLDAFKATGPGWQTLMNDVLRQNMPSAEEAPQ